MYFGLNTRLNASGKQQEFDRFPDLYINQHPVQVHQNIIFTKIYI